MYSVQMIEIAIDLVQQMKKRYLCGPKVCKLSRLISRLYSFVTFLLHYISLVFHASLL